LKKNPIASYQRLCHVRIAKIEEIIIEIVKSNTLSLINTRTSLKNKKYKIKNIKLVKIVTIVLRLNLEYKSYKNPFLGFSTNP
jgi:hypothetical protein